VIIGLQKTPVKLMPVELQDDRRVLVEEGEVVRHKEDDGVEGFNWQPSVHGRACHVQAILFSGSLHAMSCNPEGLSCPRTIRRASHGPTGGTMTERMSTLMPRTSSINGIHTDDSNMLTAWVMLVCSVVKVSGISSKLCEILDGFPEHSSSSLVRSFHFHFINQFHISLHISLLHLPVLICRSWDCCNRRRFPRETST
jgi:hypothetical protein